MLCLVNNNHVLREFRNDISIQRITSYANAANLRIFRCFCSVCFIGSIANTLHRTHLCIDIIITYSDQLIACTWMFIKCIWDLEHLIGSGYFYSFNRLEFGIWNNLEQCLVLSWFSGKMKLHEKHLKSYFKLLKWPVWRITIYIRKKANR